MIVVKRELTVGVQCSVMACQDSICVGETVFVVFCVDGG